VRVGDGAGACRRTAVCMFIFLHHAIPKLAVKPMTTRCMEICYVLPTVALPVCVFPASNNGTYTAHGLVFVDTQQQKKRRRDGSGWGDGTGRGDGTHPGLTMLKQLKRKALIQSRLLSPFVAEYSSCVDRIPRGWDQCRKVGGAGRLPGSRASSSDGLHISYGIWQAM
ncbi:unnamed protein product, partial [Ectocarpus sp. 6 AP-2014]